MKKRKNTQRKFFNLALGLLLITLAVCGSIIAFSKSFEYSFNMIDENNTRPTIKNVKQLNVTIDESSTIKEVAKLLHENDFIGNTLWFELEGKLYHSKDQLIPGDYQISNNMTNVQILKLLTTPTKEENTIRFTIPEGFTVLQIANRLEDKDIVSKDDFLNAVSNHTYDYSFLKNIPEGTKYPLEGYLFPDTYIVQKGVTAEEIVMMMLSRFEEITSRYTQYLYGSSYTLHDIVSIASIIEQEAKLDEERPIISGVIYNRLKDDMNLQMCSTVQYALDIRKKALSLDDLKVDSPYNTYLNTGLPIGPICSPGESSLHAAFMPEENDYYFFVLKDVNEGSHAFSSTANEHLAYKNKYNQGEDINFME